MSFQKVLNKYRKISFSEKDKGERFERLMKAYLLSDPKYSNKLKKVWLWAEFPGRNDLGGSDTGIDLIALTKEGDYWAIQCKCYAEGSIIDKKAIDTFVTTSGRSFKGENLKTTSFSYRLWIDTTGKSFTNNADEALKNQHIPMGKLSLYELSNAPVDWEKLENNISGEGARTSKKQLRNHQQLALTKAHDYFKAHDRGKLIMACGTGKTFNSLRIAENETNGKGLILFLVPSIALLGQTLNEWYADALEPINAICICSDPEVTTKRRQLEDIDTTSVIDLAFPASTNVDSILHQFLGLEHSPNKGLTVVFSTYQSIDVISKAQKQLATILPKYSEFDLIICDEAHRTTGVSLKGEEESSFVKVHNNDFIKTKKRLYMTATPRLFDDNAKSKAAQAEAELCSMDDVDKYGEEIYRIGFGEAVEKNLLTDYKVLILTLNEKDVPPAVQSALKDSENEISTDDASKLIGCINALSKQILGDEGIIKETDPDPMHRAVAFCQSIAASKTITRSLNVASESYIGELPVEKQGSMQYVSSAHIDGTMDATKRNELLSWLKADPEEKECRVLTNVRCLSEGVDVPSLDSVLFLSARNSPVDVVQSVGRVMRKAENKNYGYIIIPIVVPFDVEADKALDDNERYKVVWTVLNALRAHDDRFNATVNKLELNKNRPQQILVGRPEISFDENGNPIYPSEIDNGASSKNLSEQLSLQFQQLQSIVFARMVQKVGDKRYWEQWANSVAEIAKRQTARITRIINDDPKHQKAFDSFLKGLHKNINPSITQLEAIEMLSQHIITKPVFDALFEGYSFVQNNPMSQSMQKMMDLLEEKVVSEDLEQLEKFYDFVRRNVADLDNAQAKQTIIIRLYDNFFKIAFPKLVERLGIVYTPVEVVDFIIHSVSDILEKEFNRNISDENIHILDPFTGTGTFITRLLQSGRISAENLKRKYTNEIHANEIVLLAYYIAAVNIENVYHDILAETAKKDGNGLISYNAFEGICLTDTFQLGESADGEKLFSEMFPQNSKRVQRQKKAPLRIIIGNPPYSIGQRSGNDNAQNQDYPNLDSKIENTYAKHSSSGLNKSLYDAYIKAFRWSTDRLDPLNGGVIAFITNGNWLDKPSMNGFRKYLEIEFSKVYVINLRGSIRGKSGELARKEGQNIFDILTGVAITVLVKKPNFHSKAEIYYHDIGEYLNKKTKLETLVKGKTILSSNFNYEVIKPDEHYDWLNFRDSLFESFFETIPVKKFDLKSKSIFILNVIGSVSNRDSWVYNFSKDKLIYNLKNSINEYNRLREEYHTISNKPNLDDFIENKSNLLKWTRGLKNLFEKNKLITFNGNSIAETNYRPFNKQFNYYNKDLIEMPGISTAIFPDGGVIHKNFAIGISGEVRKDFSVLIVNKISDLEVVGRTQYLPLFFYEESNSNQKGMFDTDESQKYIRRDAISDFIFERAKKQYGKNVIKEDIFYYVYGFLHSNEYRKTFVNDLKKMSPRLPLVEDVKDFWTFSKAGRKLAELHLNYEMVAPFADAKVTGDDGKFYAVEKLRFPKKDQKDSIIYNNKITISNIPVKAYEYVVNGKSAIEWIMERYHISTHKESGISNNPNDWATETGNPRYILDLLLSIINVSVQTVDIVNSLPKVSFS